VRLAALACVAATAGPLLQRQSGRAQFAWRACAAQTRACFDDAPPPAVRATPAVSPVDVAVGPPGRFPLSSLDFLAAGREQLPGSAFLAGALLVFRRTAGRGAGYRFGPLS
jgi:hypothetical protein